ncbi:hypothetical protein ACTFIY_011309 [Dictyostelium cf. discoideum]
MRLNNFSFESLTLAQAAGIKPLNSGSQLIGSFNNNNSNHATKEQRTAIILENLKKYQTEWHTKNPPKDLKVDSYTSSLYINYDKKVIELPLQFIKNIGYDLYNLNLHQLVTQQEPIKILEDYL